MKLKKLAGQRFGRLVVQERAPNRGTQVMWNCICDCGKTKVVQSNHLVSGDTTSCGNCANSKKSRLHRNVWTQILQRCYNKNSKDYKNYGARGIKVCEEWHNYLNFRKWALNNGYDEKALYGKCTLDRIDVNSDYCPQNCRFVDLRTQCNNKQYNHFITYQNETKTIAEWSRITGISANALYNRFNRGWNTKRALTQPCRKRGGDKA